MLKEWLSHLGFLVETAKNGEAALERWKQKTFDVILMDKQNDDLAALSKAAHKLKGAIGKWRSERIQELTRRLETLKRQGDIEEASLPIVRLKNELQDVLGMSEAETEVYKKNGQMF